MAIAAVRETIIEQMIKLHQFAIMCAPTNSQYAAIEGLRNCEDEVEEMRKAYNQRRRFLMHEFERMGLECFEPFGAFYVFPSIKEFGMTSEEFATKLLEEEKVAVVPGTAFGDCGEGFLRISYAYSLEDLKVALRSVLDDLFSASRKTAGQMQDGVNTCLTSCFGAGDPGEYGKYRQNLCGYRNKASPDRTARISA